MIKKYDYIDALRGIAILGVMLVHASAHVGLLPSVVMAISQEGARGVQLFFIVSALTLFFSMESRRHEHYPRLSFYIRRFFRIAPLFYLSIALNLFLFCLLPDYYGATKIEWWYFPLTFLFLNGWHPETINLIVSGGWSLAVEASFYLVLPFLFFILKDIKSSVIAFLISLMVSRILKIAILNYLPGYSMIEQQNILQNYVYFWFFSQIRVFILGIILYHIIRKFQCQNKKVSDFLLAMAIIGMCLYLYFDVINFLFFSFLLAMVTLALYFYPRRFFVNDFTIFVGKLSFGLYLAHFFVIDLLNYLFTLFDVVLIGCVGLILEYSLILFIAGSVSYILHHSLELPGIRLGVFCREAFVRVLGRVRVKNNTS